MKIGLLYAMEDELKSLLHPASRLLETVSGVPFYEIAPDLIACAGGIGKVNCAMATQLLIDRYAPDVILNAGVAGAMEALPVGTVVLVESFLQHDVDTTAVGDPVGLVSTVNQTVFRTDAQPAAKQVLDDLGVDYRVGSVATGDWFAVGGSRASWIRDTFHPMLCEMEGCAAAQVCLRSGVKFLALKSVSDRLFSETQQDEYFNFPQAMQRLNAIVLPFAKKLQEVL